MITPTLAGKRRHFSVGLGYDQTTKWYSKHSSRLNRTKLWFQQCLFFSGSNGNNYCPFHKHANSKVQKPPSQLRFSLPSIIITSTSNEPWNTETHKTDPNPPITNHKPWPFEPVKVKFCFLSGPLRWLTAAKNAIVSWLLNFRIRMFVKSAVTQEGHSKNNRKTSLLILNMISATIEDKRNFEN